MKNMQKKSMDDHTGSPQDGARWERLSVQLILFFVIPLTLLLSAVAFVAVNWHEEAMRDLVLSRDERSVQLAAMAISGQAEQRQHTLNAVHAALLDGTTLNQLPVQLTYLFDRGLFLLDETGAAPTCDTDETVLIRTPENPRLVGCVSLGALGVPETLARLRTSDSAALYLFDETQTLRYSLGETTLDLSMLPTLHASPATVEHGETIIAPATIDSLGWRLIMTEPWRHVGSPQLQRSHFTPLLVLPITLLSAVLLGFGSVQVVRPLQRLRQLAAQLPQGDLAALRQPVGGIREVVALQETLVEMARRLRDAQATLRDYIGAITRAQEEERTRLARDLHDDTVQTLIALNQRVQMAQRLLKRNPQAVEARLQDLRDMTDRAITDVRRLIQAMRPSYLADLGLEAALRSLVQDVDTDGLHAMFETEGEPRRLDDEVELAFYRVAQEAINNVIKHAHAHHLTVTLSFSPTQVCLNVQDDGMGFSVPDNLLSLANAGNYGLIGMSERAQLVSGTLTIRAQPLAGTRLTMCVPAAAPERPIQAQAHL